MDDFWDDFGDTSTSKGMEHKSPSWLDTKSPHVTDDKSPKKEEKSDSEKEANSDPETEESDHEVKKKHKSPRKVNEKSPRQMEHRSAHEMDLLKSILSTDGEDKGNMRRNSEDSDHVILHLPSSGNQSTPRTGDETSVKSETDEDRMKVEVTVRDRHTPEGSSQYGILGGSSMIAQYGNHSNYSQSQSASKNKPRKKSGRSKIVRDYGNLESHKEMLSQKYHELKSLLNVSGKTDRELVMKAKKMMKQFHLADQGLIPVDSLLKKQKRVRSPRSEDDDSIISQGTQTALMSWRNKGDDSFILIDGTGETVKTRKVTFARNEAESTYSVDNNSDLTNIDNQYKQIPNVSPPARGRPVYRRQIHQRKTKPKPPPNSPKDKPSPGRKTNSSRSGSTSSPSSSLDGKDKNDTTTTASPYSSDFTDSSTSRSRSRSRSKSRSRSRERADLYHLKNTDNDKLKEWLKQKNKEFHKQKREEKKKKREERKKKKVPTATLR